MAYCLIPLVLAAIQDCRKKEISPILFPVFGCIYLALHRPSIWAVGLGIILFCIYLLSALLFKSGGGDAIMMGVLGLILGKDILYVCVIAHAVYGIAYFAAGNHKKTEKKTIPFAPMVLVAVLLVLIGKLIYYRGIFDGLWI